VQRLADELVGDVGPVVLRGVNVVHAQLHGAAQHIQRLAAITRRPPDTRAGQLHGAQADARDREITQSVAVHGTHPSGRAGTRNVAFSGDKQALSRAVEDQRAIAAARGSGDMIRATLAAQTILHLGYGEYADAYETATAMRRDDTIGMSAEALPVIVEAGLRSGHASQAAAALADLERCATASGTGWAFGLLARSTALMAPPDQAGELYQEAIDILGRTTATADLARAHLLFGE
jgi:hypothetical protein